VARPIGSGTRRGARTPEEAFGKTLTELRIEKEITQEALADSLGYHMSYIGQLARGLKSPTLRTVSNIAELFGVSVKSLHIYTIINIYLISVKKPKVTIRFQWEVTSHFPLARKYSLSVLLPAITTNPARTVKPGLI
jgi:transcriptional regulator with XRE-family HTH domain